MDKELKRIKKLTAFMKKAGILNLKSGDLELSLTPDSFHEEQSAALKQEDATSDAAIKSQFTDEEVLFWSSPGVLPDTNSEMN